MNIRKKRFMLGVAAMVTAGLVTTVASQAAEQNLSGTITSATGEKLGGVTVSAKRDGTTITTSVYTEEQGNYYFQPMETGKYNVWAQALAFETSKSAVDLLAAKRQNLALKAITDKERAFRQLPGEMMIAALPEATVEDANMKKIFMNQCTDCHAP